MAERIVAVRCPDLARKAAAGRDVDPLLRPGEPIERYCPVLYGGRPCCPPGMRPEIIRDGETPQLRLLQ